MLKIKTIVQFIKYALGGAIATVLELIILYYLTDRLGVWYVYSSIVAYGIGFTLSFIIRKFWAFRDYSLKNLGRQFTIYIIILSATLFLNTAVLVFLVEKVNLFYLLAQFISGLVIGWIGYLVNEKITFKNS